MTASRTRIALAVAVAVVLAAGPACGFRERRARADFVIETADRVREAGGARMTMVSSLRPLEITDADIQTHPFPVPMQGTVDVAGRRAASAPASGRQGSEPFLIFDRELLFARKLDAGGAERKWLRYDLGEVSDPDDPIIGFNVVNPALWVELTGGALTGSVKQLGVRQVRGERLTHFEANFDREKAFEDVLDDDAFERLTELFELMGVPSVVTPGQMWLDERGLPRRIVYEVEQRVDRNNAFELTLTFEFSAWGDKASIDRPATDDTIEVDGVLQLLGESGANRLIESFRSQVLLPTPQPRRGA